MDYIIYTFLSGIISGLLSAIFRYIEKKQKKSYLNLELLFQTILFIVFIFLFYSFFKEEFVIVLGVYINWFFIFLILNTFGTMVFEVFYKTITGKSIFDFYIKK